MKCARKLTLIAGLLLESMCDSLRSMPASVDAHAIVFQRMEGGLTTLGYATMQTKTDGVVLIASVGRECHPHCAAERQ